MLKVPSMSKITMKNYLLKVVGKKKLKYIYKKKAVNICCKYVEKGKA